MTANVDPERQGGSKSYPAGCRHPRVNAAEKVHDQGDRRLNR